MPASIGVNLRVTGHCSQGGRRYMEDFFSVAYQQTEDEKDLEYAFFGIYDGHGGSEAATYAKEHLMENIVRQKNFWSDKDEDVLRAIKEGYIATHYAMWKEQVNWPKTASGLPSTAGTTATIVFIRHAKIYIGHVGDSGVILGYQEPENQEWKARPLTNDHKPESVNEISRIHQCGGKVVTKCGVPRVVWNRPRIGHKGPVRRSTPIDEIPFLAVARSLGDLWSYNSACDQFVVSPDPDTCVIPIDSSTFRCLIFGTDGLWNMMSPETAVQIVQTTERHNECLVFSPSTKPKVWINPSKNLVEHSLERWNSTRMRADNTTAVTLLLDPPGPPRAEVLKNQHKETLEAVSLDEKKDVDKKEEYPPNGLAIVTRYPLDQYTPTKEEIKPCTEESKPPKEENIQINEISSSSPEESALNKESIDKFKRRMQKLKIFKAKSTLMGRCTRSNEFYQSRRLRTSLNKFPNNRRLQLFRNNQELRRKKRVAEPKNVETKKAKVKCNIDKCDQENETQKTPVQLKGRLRGSASNTPQEPSSSTPPPPQLNITNRNLRERNVITTINLKKEVPGGNKRCSNNNRKFLPTKTSVQTRNRVKRLHK